MPKWLFTSENYIAHCDKDTFVNKSILSVLKLVSRMKMQDSSKTLEQELCVPVRILFTGIFLVLISLTRSFAYVMIANVYLLFVLSLLEPTKLIKLLKISLGITIFTAVIMLPAFLMGNYYSSVMITCKVFATITIMGIFSHTIKWNSITASLKRFFIPDLFILILDISIKYMYLLGEFALNMLYALKLRCVGINHSKSLTMAQVTGSMFLQSKEMAEEMYQAMECRGFCGEYHVNANTKLKFRDCAYIAINIGFILLFIYFGRI